MLKILSFIVLASLVTLPTLAQTRAEAIRAFHACAVETAEGWASGAIQQPIESALLLVCSKSLSILEEMDPSLQIIDLEETRAVINEGYENAIFGLANRSDDVSDIGNYHHKTAAELLTRFGHNKIKNEALLRNRLRAAYLHRPHGIQFFSNEYYKDDVRIVPY